MLLILKLLLDERLLSRLLDDVFCQGVRVADSAVHHAGNCVRALAHNADDLELYAV